MSPEGRSVADFVEGAVTRARRSAVARAAGVALLCSATVAGLAAAAGRSMAPWAAVTGAAVWLWIVLRILPSRAAVIRRLEHVEPAYRNLLITADELLRSPETSVALRGRVFADAMAVSRRVDPGGVFPLRFGMITAAAGALAWTAVLIGVRAPGFRASMLRSLNTTAAGEHVSTGAVTIVATLEPPAYTRQSTTTRTNPDTIQAIEGSRLTLVLDARTADRVTVVRDDQTRALTGAAGRFEFRDTLTKNGVLTIDVSGRRHTLPIVVVPDALPSVRVVTPGRDVVLADRRARFPVEVQAVDDYGLRALALRYTKVSGSGEQFAFTEGEIPLAGPPAEAREWHASARLDLAALGLEDGDMLVYRAIARDARPGDGTASSDAFFVEISKTGAAAGDAFTLPEEETRYALSQQMLIVKTERLQARRASMAAAEFSDQATNLAIEQRMIRAEFVFMLGGEVEDEEEEAGRSNELQEGRLRNRGQRDLREATLAMTRAEQQLAAGNTAGALTAERAAVSALQRAFAKDRYILRALAARDQLDPTRRLTGDLSSAASWQRHLPSAEHNRRAAQLQDLLRGIADLARDESADALLARTRASLLAEQALRTDVSSPALRDAGMSLQHAADALSAGRRGEARRELDAASIRIASEATRAFGPAPLPAGDRSALEGPFADAVSAARRR